MARLFAVHRGAEANRKLRAAAARAEMKRCYLIWIAIPTGVPAMTQRRHGGTTRVFVHRVLSGLGRYAVWRPGGRVNIDRASDRFGQPWLRPIRCGYGRRLPDAFQRAGPQRSVPMAKERGTADRMRVGTGWHTIAVCRQRLRNVGSSARAQICASFANIAHLQFR
jgi:hypothetical protein